MNTDYLQPLTCALLLHFIVITSAASQPTNWPVHLLEDNVELISVRNGIQLDLECGGRNKHNRQVDLHKPHNRRVNLHKPHNITWLYKHCGFGYNVTACNKLPKDSSWKILPCDGDKRHKSCKHLILLNTTEDDSGLYRCIMSSSELNGPQFKTYQLKVIDANNIPPPQLLDELPKNTTAIVSNPAVLQCRVLSRFAPTIRWFRRRDVEVEKSDHFLTHFNFLKHLNDFYEFLNDSNVKQLDDDIYLSKYIISQANENDSGYYVCLAITTRGISYDGAYLTVVSPRMSGMEIQEGTKSMHLSLLFLIPAALALVPATVWLCCLWRRRCKKSSSQSEVEENMNNNTSDRGLVREYNYHPVRESQIQLQTTI